MNHPVSRAGTGRSKLRQLTLFAVLTLLNTHAQSGEADRRLYGVWRISDYIVQGVSHKARGLVNITPKYFLADAVFDFDDDAHLSANANSGPYHVKDGKIVLEQEIQLHWRPGQKENENFLRQNVEETFAYQFDNGRLLFLFPSGNRYVLERAP
jgi:hypothetical protein